MLNWKQKVSENSKKNVQSLIDEFNKFIKQNHKSQFSYDQKVRKQWEAFRKVIQIDPIDVEAHNKYVNMMKAGINDKNSKINEKILSRMESISPILMQINRNKLEQIAKKTSKLIAKNSKNFAKY